MSGDRIGILLVDDQQLFVQSLRYVIAGSAPDMEVLGVARGRGTGRRDG